MFVDRMQARTIDACPERASHHERRLDDVQADSREIRTSRQDELPQVDQARRTAGDVVIGR